MTNTPDPNLGKPAVPDSTATSENTVVQDNRFKAELSRQIRVFWQSQLGRKLFDIFYETMVMVAYMAAIALLHKVQDNWIGKDAKLFNYIPISYIIDVGHLLAISRFLLEIVKSVLEAIKDIIRTLFKG